MSSTTRTNEERATQKDVYYTPAWVTDAILPVIPNYFMPPEIARGLRVLEPAAGNGAIVRQLMAAPWCASCDMIEIRSEEMAGLEELAAWGPWSVAEDPARPGFLPPRVIIGDFLATASHTTHAGLGPAETKHISPFLFRDEVDVVMTNPPYNAPYKGIGFDFVKRAFEYVKRTGIVVMHLPLHFLGSATRYEWFSVNEPDQYTLYRRPSYTGKGTDSLEYAWFIWEKRNLNRRKVGKLFHLYLPPKNGKPDHKTPDHV